MKRAVVLLAIVTVGCGGNGSNSSGGAGGARPGTGGSGGAAGGAHGGGGATGTGGTNATGGGTHASGGAGGVGTTGGAGGTGHGGTSGNGGTAGTAGHGGMSGNGGRTGNGGAGGATLACGAPSDPACPPGQFCSWSDERCGKDIVHGVCKSPVGGVACAQRTSCGCDGVVYASPCDANASGTDLAINGSCTPPTGTFTCGWTFCTLGTQYCNAQRGGPVGNPGSYACTAVPSSCTGNATCACITPSASTFDCTQSSDGGVTVIQELP